jgi:hypothetical protein
VNVSFSAPDKIQIYTDVPVAFDLTILTHGPKITTPIQSTPLHLVFEDRCRLTTLQGGSNIGPIVASELGPSVTTPFTIPSITLANLIGLSDACGPLS